jgi:hypothetical protein
MLCCWIAEGGAAGSLTCVGGEQRLWRQPHLGGQAVDGVPRPHLDSDAQHPARDGLTTQHAVRRATTGTVEDESRFVRPDV